MASEYVEKIMNIATHNVEDSIDTHCIILE